MSRRTISLKCRVRYEGRVSTIDRRSEIEKLPNPIWYTVGQVLRQNFQRVVRGSRGGNTTPKGR